MAPNNDQVVYIHAPLVIICLRHSEKFRMSEASFRPNPPGLHPLHFVKSWFTDKVDKQLVREAEIGKVEKWQKYIVLIYDEMHVRENLVYHKATGELVRFVE